jgi:ribosomal protein S18 acetylase RimI-like enzyme
VSAVVASSEAVRGLQERAARALPAEQVEKLDGWWLRHAPGCAWWVGTVLPHGAANPSELVRRVGKAEESSARHGTTAVFQICPPACPEALDAILAGRGYRRRTLVSLQAASTAQVLEGSPQGAPAVRLHDRPTRPWFEAWRAVHGLGGDDRGERDMLNRLERPSAYAAAMIGDDIVAVGRAVADTGWAGVFGMATLPHGRRRGAGRCVLAALAEWGSAHDAERMYLQVECDNVPALDLYNRAGFSEICRYHYRAAE